MSAPPPPSCNHLCPLTRRGCGDAPTSRQPPTLVAPISNSKCPLDPHHFVKPHPAHTAPCSESPRLAPLPTSVDDASCAASLFLASLCVKPLPHAKAPLHTVMITQATPRRSHWSICLARLSIDTRHRMRRAPARQSFTKTLPATSSMRLRFEVRNIVEPYPLPLISVPCLHVTTSSCQVFSPWTQIL
jgi:hypothetical protein